jgi:hypothetical protein
MMSFLRHLLQEWKILSGYIGDFQARLLLTIFYFTALFPIGILLYLLSDPMQIHHQPQFSAWMKRPERELNIHEGERQF